MDDPCFYGFPDLRRGRSEGGAGRGRPGGHGRHADASSRTRRRSAHGGLPREVHPEGARPDHLHQDLPVHPDARPGLRGRPAARPSQRGRWAIGGGHGYKFASLIGRILSELAIDGRTEHEHRAVPDRPRDSAARESAGELHGLTGVGVRGSGGGDARAGRWQGAPGGGIAQGLECALTLPLRASPPPAPGAPIPGRARPSRSKAAACSLPNARRCPRASARSPSEARASCRPLDDPSSCYVARAGGARRGSVRAHSHPLRDLAAAGAPCSDRREPRRPTPAAQQAPRDAPTARPSSQLNPALTPARDSATPPGRTAPTGSPASSTAPAYTRATRRRAGSARRCASPACWSCPRTRPRRPD